MRFRLMNTMYRPQVLLAEDHADTAERLRAPASAATVSTTNDVQTRIEAMNFERGYLMVRGPVNRVARRRTPGPSIVKADGS